MSGKAARSNQKHRTRKDLLRAAARLLKEGRTPSLEEIAEAALVSRATAYRYFPGVEALLLEASFDVETPEPEAVFPPGTPDDPVERLGRADAALHELILENGPALRTMLAHALTRGLTGEAGGEVPQRQNRRTPLIEAALDPVRDRLGPDAFDRLCNALALVIGTEGMIVFQDVLQVTDEEARATKRWAIRALVEAALRGEGSAPDGAATPEPRRKSPC
mgnify:CR=1 FL=1